MSMARIKQANRRTILFGGLCLVTVLAGTFGLLYPQYQTAIAQNERLELLGLQIREQQALAPLFTELARRAQNKTPRELQTPPLEKLKRQATGDIAAVCRDIASSCDVALKNVRPEIGATNTMMLEVVFRGDFFHFRDLLLRLGNLPYLHGIEKISVASIQGGREIKLKLKIAHD